MTRPLVRALASGLGAGRCPQAPGTAGTLAAMPVAWLLDRLPDPVHLAALAAALPLAAWVCGAAARAEGGGDPGWVVLDEMVGFWVAVALVPPSLVSYGLAFVLFRLFDILKPPPAGWIDRHVTGGWGILLDDVAAGLMTRAALGVLQGAGVL
ncbi:MAG: phosphatidylglycerophosphatase A family protein [Deferrisomatales bacterium]